MNNYLGNAFKKSTDISNEEVEVQTICGINVGACGANTGSCGIFGGGCGSNSDSCWIDGGFY